MLHVNKSNSTQGEGSSGIQPSEVNFGNAFAVVSGPDRQAMNFPSPANRKPELTEFTVELPCGPARLALSLLGNYSYSRIDTQLIQLTGEVVGISSDDGNEALPDQTSWQKALKENPIRICYHISEHTGKLFLQSTASASA